MREQRGVVPTAGADLQHLVAVVDVELVEHAQHQARSGAAGDRCLVVPAGFECGHQRLRRVHAVQVIGGVPADPRAGVVLVVGAGHEDVPWRGCDCRMPSGGPDVARLLQLICQAPRVRRPFEVYRRGHGCPFIRRSASWPVRSTPVWCSSHPYWPAGFSSSSVHSPSAPMTKSNAP